MKKTKIGFFKSGINFAGYIIRSKYMLVKDRMVSKTKSLTYDFMKKKDFSYKSIKKVN